MALADPISFTISDVTYSLPRVSIDGESSTYRLINDDGSYVEFVVSHNTAKRRRHVVRLNFGTVTEDPITETNVLQSTSCTLTMDSPLTGISQLTQIGVVSSLLARLLASDYAVLNAVIRGQS